MHGNGFFVDADVNDPSQVNTPATLSIGIKDGMQVNQLNTMGANRLLVFTGIVTNRGLGGADDNVYHGVFRVRLRFPMAPNVIFKASATIAALAGVHGEGDEDLTWGADTVVTVTDPTDGGTLSGKPPLPDNELYVIIDAGYQGKRTNLAGISYQANVLVQDLDPDFEAILVRIQGDDWTPAAVATVTTRDGLFDIKVVLTGPALDFFDVDVKSDNNNAPVGRTLPVAPGTSDAQSFGFHILANTPPNTVVKITGTYISKAGKKTIKTATILIRGNQ